MKPAILVVTSLALSVAAHAQERGIPLTPSISVRGPVQHLVVGGSVVTPSGAVLSSVSAPVSAPPGSAVVHARLVWLGSGFASDPNMTLTLPDGAVASIVADDCSVIDASLTGGAAALPYWKCGADVTALFAGVALAGNVSASGIDVDTGAPWSNAQGWVGAFSLVIIYADPNDVRPRVLQVAEGLLWSKTSRTSSPALLPFAAASSAGKLSVVAVEGDAELPGDGECIGILADPSCDFVGLCRGPTCEPLLFGADDDNAPGHVFNESTGDALDVDSFDLGGQLDAGTHEDVRAFVQTGSDAVIQALVVVEVPDVDTDEDGLADAAELEIGTDAFVPDTDGDGLLDGTEVYGRSPADPASTPTDPLMVDTDGDDLSDGQEDLDHDGVRDVDETSPIEHDSDGDGLDDGLERLHASYAGPNCVDGHSNALAMDTDGDGELDGAEDANGNGAVDDGETSPCQFDEDPPPPRDRPEIGVIGPTEPYIPPDTRPQLELIDLGDVDLGRDELPVETKPAPIAHAVDGGHVKLVDERSATELGALSGSTIWGCSATNASAPGWLIALSALGLAVRRRRPR